VCAIYVAALPFVNSFSIGLPHFQGPTSASLASSTRSIITFRDLHDLHKKPTTRAKSCYQKSSSLSLRAIIDYDDIEHVILRGKDGKNNMPDNWVQSGVYACFDKMGVMQYVAMSRKVAASIEAHMQVVGPDCHTAKAVVWEKPTKADLESTARGWIEKCVHITGDAPPGNTPDVAIWRMKPSDLIRAKSNLQFESGATAADAEAQIRKIIDANRVVLFMKGTHQAPQVPAVSHHFTACREPPQFFLHVCDVSVSCVCVSHVHVGMYVHYRGLLGPSCAHARMPCLRMCMFVLVRRARSLRHCVRPRMPIHVWLAVRILRGDAGAPESAAGPPPDHAPP
jgi:hypothetical protein